MRVLISAVGDTDPFRNFHDGALIHIKQEYSSKSMKIIKSISLIERLKIMPKNLVRLY